MKANWVNNGASPTGFTWKSRDDFNSVTGRRVQVTLGEPNYKAIWWLELAIHSARSVARVKMPNGSASGFLIGPDLFMTNNHVFEDENDAANAILQFNYRLLADETLAQRDEWECDPDDTFVTNPNLDYSIVRVKEKDGQKAGDAWGHLNLHHGAAVFDNQRVNIIQHPQGRFQEIVFRDNQVRAVGEQIIQYLTDSDYGTSGSPVFDDWFNVVALHNQRVRDPNNPDRWYRNQGYLVKAIIADTGNLIPT